MRLDFPTLLRPANAISGPRIGGSLMIVSVAAKNCQSAANSFRPASISAALKGMEKFYFFSLFLSFLFSVFASVSATFLGLNVSRILSNSSILAPCLFMMKACCSTESVLFQAQ